MRPLMLLYQPFNLYKEKLLRSRHVRSHFFISIMLMGLILSGSSMMGCGSSKSVSNEVVDSVKNYVGHVSHLHSMDRLASTIYAANFVWWDSTGTVRQLHDYYGKAAVITFWGTWSASSLSDLAVLAQLQKQYADSSVIFIGITLREPPGSKNEILERIVSYCSAHGINYQQVIGNSELAASYGGIYQLPTTITVSSEDKVLETLAGAQGRANLEAAVRRAIYYVAPK